MTRSRISRPPARPVPERQAARLRAWLRLYEGPPQSEQSSRYSLARDYQVTLSHSLRAYCKCTSRPDDALIQAVNRRSICSIYLPPTGVSALNPSVVRPACEPRRRLVQDIVLPAKYQILLEFDAAKEYFDVADEVAARNSGRERRLVVARNTQQYCHLAPASMVDAAQRSEKRSHRFPD